MLVFLGVPKLLIFSKLSKLNVENRINRGIIVRLGNLRVFIDVSFLGVPKLLIFSKLPKLNVENIRFWCGVMGSIRF